MTDEKKIISQNSESTQKVLWQPHPGPQTEVLRRPEYEILFGGAEDRFHVPSRKPVRIE